MADEPATEAGKPRANTLDGVTWTRYSISIWSDIHKTAEERALEHPALFPAALVGRLLDCFTRPGDRLVIDPFCGIGSTLLAARAAGKDAVGVELSPEFVEVARARLAAQAAPPDAKAVIYNDDATNLLEYVAPGTADFCTTSPPYWDILARPRSADHKPTRDYGDLDGDLGQITDYDAFLGALLAVMGRVFVALRPGAYACVVVMDLRKKTRLYSFHADLAAQMQEIGFIYDDMLIWDRRADYNNLRPLGYPYKFRVNRVHEFILIFQKP
ncbi:MAG: site-specific DNA-methyltransferase [Anaerolineae bacterium]|nr:site-specific DNA-methyltransferase [Anaerolineae bacterium]